MTFSLVTHKHIPTITISLKSWSFVKAIPGFEKHFLKIFGLAIEASGTPVPLGKASTRREIDMGHTVLTVDDAKAVRAMVSFALEPHGYTVIEAENGQDGLSKLSGAKVDLIITDLNMPVMDGFDFIRSVRADPAQAGVPIIMLTTESAPEKKAIGKEAGATGWLNKPFDEAQLIAIAKKLAG
jgi:two-component system chemotaxis response regulator CheY